MVGVLYFTGLLFLVIAVSLDGFGVGITYGVRSIRVPFSALAIIMTISGLVVLGSMTIGTMLSSIISPDSAQIVGASILVFLGFFAIFNIVRSKKQPSDRRVKEHKKLRVFNKVIKTPVNADIDDSGVISTKEAFLLGIALALDAFGAGLGAAIIGYDPILTASLIAVMSGLFVYSGIRIGIILASYKKVQELTFIAPLLLIALGIFNMFR